MTTASAGGRRGEGGRLRTYRAFGLTLACDLELAELPLAPDGPADIRVISGAIPRAIPTMEEGVVVDFAGKQTYLGWPRLGHFMLLPDNTIVYEAAPDCESLLGFPLLGPVLSLVLHRAGRLLLHSSAIGRNERTVFFLGDKGAGKSTTAAALVGAGFDLVTDDVLAITADGGAEPIATPGFPQLKLAPRAAPLIGDVARIELTGTDKHRVRLLQAFTPAPHTMAAGYVLVRGQDAGLRRLDSVAALKAVLRHSYAARFERRLFDAEGLARHLKQSASVADRVPIYELSLPHDLARLTDIVGRVVADVLA